MGRPRTVDVVLGVRREVSTWEYTVTRVRCGRCGHEFDTIGAHTGTCKRCNRTCRLDQAATAENVIPMRRRPA